MKLLNLSSNDSFWRGVDYHHEKKVKSWKQIDKDEYYGEVGGSHGEVYHVQIDIEHPRRSTCDCPFANGRRVICKHMVALNFAIFPEKEKQMMEYIEEQNEKYKQELENEKEEKRRSIRKYVMSLSKAELREELISRMICDMEDDYNDYNRWY